MYFDWPNKDQAYCYDQFMFGPYILVAPIMSPSGDGQHGSQSRIVWLPEGKWYEYFSGKAVEGGRMIKTESDIYTLPVYIKAGSIIPTVPLRRNVSEPCDTIILTIYPHIGIGSTEYVLYDDAGDAFGFENGERSLTPILFNTNMDETKTITIGATDGTWPNAPAQMNYTIVMVDIPRPISVNVNGKPSQYWQWSDNRLKIETGLVNCDKGVTVNIN
jgi:alpha-glucosidase (family GH31 glycosyl hydrolase)